MRGTPEIQRSLLMVGSIDDRIPQEHPIRPVKVLADRVLGTMGAVFDAMYASTGRPSVPPERLLKAQLLIALFSVRSDRQFCEQLEYNLLFRWFLDMDLDEPAFDASTFSQNRERLIGHRIGEEFLAAVVREAKRQRLLSEDHFSVDGTLIQAWASMKSFRPKGEPPGDSNGWSDFKGEKRSNDTHESKTDPDARLARKGNGQEAKLSYCGSVLMENRNGLVVDIDVATADGRAEREGALRMLKRRGRGRRRRTVGGDKAYDTRDFVDGSRTCGFTPHPAQNQHRTHRSAVDGRTTRHPGYAVSKIVRRRIEQIFGWVKGPGGLRRARVRGLPKVSLAAQLGAAAYDLLRIAHLSAAEATT
jgi:transposase